MFPVALKEEKEVNVEFPSSFLIFRRFNQRTLLANSWLSDGGMFCS